MSEILKVELQDEEGNTYYLKTDANNVYCTDGTSVQTKLDAKIDTANIVNNATTDDINKIVSAAVAKALQDQLNQLSNDLSNKVSTKSEATLYHLNIDASIYPGVDFKTNSSKNSSIFDYGDKLTLRQFYSGESSYKEITVPELLSMNEKSLQYKGVITDGLLQTIDTGMYHYDGASSSNVPSNAGTGVIYSFHTDTVLTYRLCITSSNGVWYSVFIPGQTYGVWKRLKDA